MRVRQRCFVCGFRSAKPVCPRCNTILRPERAVCSTCGKAFDGWIAACDACGAPLQAEPVTLEEREAVRSLCRQMPDHPGFQGMIIEINGSEAVRNLDLQANQVQTGHQLRHRMFHL